MAKLPRGRIACHGRKRRRYTAVAISSYSCKSSVMKIDVSSSNTYRTVYLLRLAVVPHFNIHKIILSSRFLSFTIDTNVT